jgi:hypothetical protein
MLSGIWICTVDMLNKHLSCMRIVSQWKSCPVELISVLKIVSLLSLIRLCHNCNCCNSCQLHTCLPTSENYVHWSYSALQSVSLLSLVRMCYNFKCRSRGQLRYINYVVKSSRVVTREVTIQVKVCETEGRKIFILSIRYLTWLYCGFNNRRHKCIFVLLA